MKTNLNTLITVEDTRHCSMQLCVDCFVQSGCLHMGHAFDIPDSWDIKQADDLLFKKRYDAVQTIHATYSTIHSKAAVKAGSA